MFASLTVIKGCYRINNFAACSPVINWCALLLQGHYLRVRLRGGHVINRFFKVTCSSTICNITDTVVLQLEF